MASTTATTYSSAIKTVWQDELIAIAQGKTVVDKFAVTKGMAPGAGGTVTFNKVLRPSLQTSTATLGSLITPSSAKGLSTNSISVTPILMQDYFSFDDSIEFKSFISNEDNKKAIGNQMALSLDRYAMHNYLGVQCMRHRIDNDGNFQKTFTADSGSTTTIVDSALGAISDDVFNGGFATVTNPDGPNYDITRAVTDFATTSGTITTAAFPQAMTSASRGRVTVGTNIVAGDKLTISGLADCAALLERAEAEPFAGGIYRGFIHSFQLRDLISDSSWTNTATYSAAQRWEQYTAYRWFGMEVLVGSNIRVESTAGVQGTYDGSTYLVFVAPFFGANSYALMPWGHGMGQYGTKFYVVDQPDSQNLTLNAKFLSWKAHFAGQVLRATNVVGLMTGATDLVFDNGM